MWGLGVTMSRGCDGCKTPHVALDESGRPFESYQRTTCSYEQLCPINDLVQRGTLSNDERSWFDYCYSHCTFCVLTSVKDTENNKANKKHPNLYWNWGSFSITTNRKRNSSEVTLNLIQIWSEHYLSKTRMIETNTLMIFVNAGLVTIFTERWPSLRHQQFHSQILQARKRNYLSLFFKEMNFAFTVITFGTTIDLNFFFWWSY